MSFILFSAKNIVVIAYYTQHELVHSCWKWLSNQKHFCFVTFLSLNSLNQLFKPCLFQVDEMYREAPISRNKFDYNEFTRILKHGKKEKDDEWSGWGASLSFLAHWLLRLSIRAASHLSDILCFIGNRPVNYWAGILKKMTTSAYFAVTPQMFMVSECILPFEPLCSTYFSSWNHISMA